MSRHTRSIDQLQRELDEARRRIAELEDLPRETQERLRKQRTVLAELASGEEIRRGDLPSCFRRSTEAAACTLDVERVGVWLFDADRSRLVLHDLYEVTPDRHSSDLRLEAVNYPRYFEALETGRGIAADDALRDPSTREFAEMYLQPLGISSMLDAPIRVGGELQGVVCHEHVGPPRRWAFEEMQFAASIADFVSLALEFSEQRRGEQLASSKNEVLRLLARGRPLGEVLDRLARSVEEQREGMLCSVLVLDEEGAHLRHGAAPNLPAEFAAAIDGMTVGSDQSPCSRAVHEGRRVVVEDLTTDDRWSGREHAIKHGLRACWSEPVLGHERQILGILALYSLRPRKPEASDLRLLESVANLAGVAIEHHRADESKRQLNLAVAHAMAGIARTDTRGRFVAVNDGYANTLGYAADELIGKHWSEVVHVEDVKIVEGALESLGRSGRAELEARAVKRDGSVFHCRVLVVGVVSSRQSRPREGYVCFLQDITEAKKSEDDRARLEEQLRQSQKMDAIGQLAGGVAHDFNNLLTAILGNAEMLLEVLAESPEEQRDPFVLTAVEEIQRAGKRAASLTGQLLAFGRKQPRRVERIDPNALVLDLQSMLGRIIGEDIELVTRLAEELPGMNADAAQMEQVLLNLAVNARDAMPRGGTLTIETKLLGPGDVPGLKPPLGGPHIELSVSDTGSGMSPETLERAFEPFFTTKPVGKGTGLGLATVYGIVAQSGGRVLPDSELGQGTTVRVMMPATKDKAAPPPEEQDRRPSREAPGTETILLCEDDAIVRSPARRALESCGYTVLEAATPQAAIELFEAHDSTIDLLLTDTVMPGMNGRALADELTGRRPGIKVLFVSGYTRDVIGKDGKLDDQVEFLGKPFNATTLLSRVRDVLDK